MININRSPDIKPRIKSKALLIQNNYKSTAHTIFNYVVQLLGSPAKFCILFNSLGERSRDLLDASTSVDFLFWQFLIHHPVFPSQHDTEATLCNHNMLPIAEHAK